MWLLPFYMTVAAYFYHEKERRTMHTAILSYHLELLSGKNDATALWNVLEENYKRHLTF